MSPVDVVWEPYRPGECNRGVWDQAIVEKLLAGRWTAPGWPEFVHHDGLDTVPAGNGVILVIPARHHTSEDDQQALNGMLSGRPWALVILTGDEEHLFPLDWWQDTARCLHGNIRWWVQTPDPARTYPAGTRYLVNGPAPLAYGTTWGERTRDVVLLAQDTHERRHACADAVQAILDSGRTGHLTRSAGFTQGLPPQEYMDLMASARVCPAPSGPVCVDSFRAWEAMELGAVPVLDAAIPGPIDQINYWTRVAGPDHGLSICTTWGTQLAPAVDAMVAEWPFAAARDAAWWMRYQRDMARNLVADLRDLGAPLSVPDVDDQITVLMPTSPIPSHPSTAILRETVESVRAQLPHAEILILCDGPNPSMEHRRQEYEEYLYEVARLCREKWSNVLPVIHDTHLHQSGMTQYALTLVNTPTVLFVEHDCPIRGSIPWRQMVDAITDDAARVIRLHHEARIHPEHEHLMLGPSVDIRGVLMAPTQQWSQRPHLASTGLYRRAIADHFEGRACMIEDVLHGVVQTDTAQGHWDRWKLHILTEPNGEHGMRRSWHTDGRAGGEKWIGEL